VITQLFTFSSTIERLRQGPLSEYLDTYATGLAEQGYTDHSIRRQIVVIADFSRWLKRKHIDVQALDNKVVDQFLRLRRRQQQVGRGDPKALARMVAMLWQIGVVKQPQPSVAVTPRSRITSEFRRYLLEECGRSPATVKNYVPFIDQFLSERFPTPLVGSSRQQAHQDPCGSPEAPDVLKIGRDWPDMWGYGKVTHR